MNEQVFRDVVVWMTLLLFGLQLLFWPSLTAYRSSHNGLSQVTGGSFVSFKAMFEPSYQQRGSYPN
jgi:hypothetical protein